MTVDTEEEGREGAAGPWGWEARHPHTPSLGAPPPKPPSLTAGVRPGEGLRVLQPSWSPAREDRVGLPSPQPRPSAFLPRGPRRTHLLRAKVALSCGGRGESSPPRVRRRLGAPGRRLSARRTPSRVGSWLLRGCGGGMRCGWGDRGRRAERTHPRDLPRSSSFSSHPSGRASAARYRLDPFQGWAPRTRRQVQRSASCGGSGCVGGGSSRPPARPGRPRGPRGTALLERSSEKGKADREVLSPHPHLGPGRDPLSRGNDASLAPGGAAGLDGRLAGNCDNKYRRRLLSAY